jgi:hypothetical protein
MLGVIGFQPGMQLACSGVEFALKPCMAVFETLELPCQEPDQTEEAKSSNVQQIRSHGNITASVQM